MREEDWTVTAEVERLTPRPPRRPTTGCSTCCRDGPGKSALGLAIDIGTTTVAAYLGDLSTGRLIDRRIRLQRPDRPRRGRHLAHHLRARPKRRPELQERVVATVNELIDEMLPRQDLTPEDLAPSTVAGNTTMTHLFLGLQARLHPTRAVRAAPPALPSRCRPTRLGLHVHPEAMVDCLPAVGAYVGGDITAGVLRSGMHEDEHLTLFIDVGTNGEMVLGNSEWLISCACSPGPAFEGAGAASGVRAVAGAQSTKSGSTPGLSNRP